jgi:hypothetical protein
MTILTPKHEGAYGHTAEKAVSDFDKWQRKHQEAEAQRKACPVPGAVLSSWQPPAEYGAIIERQRVPVIRLTIKLHGIDA